MLALGRKFLKYLSLWWMFFKSSFIADLEFRMNFVSRIFADIFWYFAQIFTFDILFQHTPQIGAWNLEQTRVFLGLLFVIDAIYMILIHDNFDRFSDRIRKGDLDLLLAKPVNSQFMMSLQRSSTAILGNLSIATGWLVYSLWNLPDFHWSRLFWLIVFIPCGVIVFYFCRFMFAASAVIFTRTDSLQFIWYQLYKLGMRPDSVYSPWFRYVLLSLLPVAVIASVPARAILEAPDYGLFIWSVVLSVLCLWLTTKYWKFVLRYYTSASS